LKTIVLVGQHNSGKSTLFDALNDINITPTGATVDYQISEIDVYGETVRIIDLPGIYSLNPTDPAEKITIDYLLNEEYDAIINVVNSTFFSRSLELTIELYEFGKPMIIVLNKIDEAEKNGINIFADKLNEILNTQVVKTNVRFGKGIKNLVNSINELLYKLSKNGEYRNHQIRQLSYTTHLEKCIQEISSQLENIDGFKNGSLRFWAIKSLENPELFPKEINGRLHNLTRHFTEELFTDHGIDNFEIIAYERHHLAMKLSEECSQLTKIIKSTFNDKLDNILLHPIFGNFFLIIFFTIYFVAIFYVGSFLSSLIDKPITDISLSFESLKHTNPFLWYSLNGAYMGFAGVFGIVLPYFLPLVFLTSVFEETEYTSRIAFLLDGFMHKIGLHGKSIIPFIMGFGCSVPAIYATRIIENKRDRILTGILIPFVPCTARIAVIFALAAALAGPIWAIVIFAFVGLVIAISGKIISKLIAKPQGMIMEINDLKLPSLKISLQKTWFKTKEFMKEALIFLVGGSIILGWIEYFGIAKYIDNLFAPLIDFILGLPKELGSTLLFGFFRKELIIVMANQALSVPSISLLPLTTQQIVVFVIFVTLYFPCFTTLVVLWKEFGKKTAIYASIFSMIVSTIAAFLFKMFFELIT